MKTSVAKVQAMMMFANFPCINLKKYGHQLNMKIATKGMRQKYKPLELGNYRPIFSIYGKANHVKAFQQATNPIVSYVFRKNVKPKFL
jgi:hypothetical protein